MGNPVKKRKEDTSSDSNSDSDSSSSREKKTTNEQTKKRRSSSYSDSEKEQKTDKPTKKEVEKIDIIEKRKKYDDVQSSKWDSPAENISKNIERKIEARTRRHSDRDDSKESRKHYDRPKNDKRDDYRNKNVRNDERRYKDNRHNKDRGRYDRRQNDDRYRSDRRKSRERSRSREDNRREKREDFKPRGNRRQKFDGDDHENYDWGKKKPDEDKKPPADKEKPNFGLSGKLTEDTNTYRGVVIKYSEPTEARKPKRRWRLYPFKGEKALPTLYIHRESAYLMGRDRKVVDFPLDHPSCSKQHAVLQYRLVPFTRDNGTTGKRVRPYIIDLDSANGTFINNKQIDPRKYVELLEKDVIKFGYSTREYVLLHENSKDEAMDDDVKPEDEEVEVAVKEEPPE